MSRWTGAGVLTKLAFRRDRLMLVVWIYVLTAFVAATVYGFDKLYPLASGREQFAAAAGHNPPSLSLYGDLSGNSLRSLPRWRETARPPRAAARLSACLGVS